MSSYKTEAEHSELLRHNGDKVAISEVKSCDRQIVIVSSQAA